MRKDREKGKEEREKQKRGEGVLELRRPPSPVKALCLVLVISDNA
jgi:hypothetical protein